MVLLFNLIPVVLLGLVVLSIHRAIKSNRSVFRKVVGSVVIGLFAFYIYSQIQPSYIPKGTVPSTLKIAPVDFADKELPPIENRLLSAKPEEERQADLKEVFDWRTQVESSKTE